jgi:hypothetical protein
MTAGGRSSDVRISGSPTPHEVAAVLAALRAFETAVDKLSSYERWRRGRIAALRRYSRPR